MASTQLTLDGNTEHHVRVEDAVATRVDDEIALLHDEGPTAQQVRGGGLDGSVARVLVAPILRLSSQQVGAVKSDARVIPLASKEMALNEEVRVRGVEAAVGVDHGEERRQRVAPGEQLLVQRQYGLVVGQLNREGMVRDATHDFGKLMPESVSVGFLFASSSLPSRQAQDR